MANKYTAMAIPDKSILENLYHNDFLSQVEIGAKFNTSQKVVFRWFKVLGIKSRKPYIRNQRGDKNGNWGGTNVTYSALHIRVEKDRGKPSYCEMCGTNELSIRYEWACTGDYYDTNSYMRMCAKCHRNFDKSKHGVRNYMKMKK